MPVELALTPDGRWEIGTTQLVEAAHLAGFTALGLYASRAGFEAAAAYVAAGMCCHELLAPLFSDDEPATLASAEKLAEAAALVSAEWVLTVFRSGLNRDTAGLMIDSWHFSFGDSTWKDLASVPLEKVAYVQFADGLAPVSADLMRETMDRRVRARSRPPQRLSWLGGGDVQAWRTARICSFGGGSRGLAMLRCFL